MGWRLLLILIKRRGIVLSGKVVGWISSFFSLHWLYRLTAKGYDLLGRGVALVILVLEGEGGILWALLMLILLMALIAQGAVRGV